jgi:hypothetical protein
MVLPAMHGIARRRRILNCTVRDGLAFARLARVLRLLTIRVFVLRRKPSSWGAASGRVSKDGLRAVSSAFDHLVRAALAGATLTASDASPSGGLLGFRLAQGRADLPRCLHGAPDGLLLRVIVKKQQDLAGRALAGIAVLKPARTVAEYPLAAAAADLDGIVEHCRASLIWPVQTATRRLFNRQSKAAQTESKSNAKA